jgi:hypothetical protein
MGPTRSPALHFSTLSPAWLSPVCEAGSGLADVPTTPFGSALSKNSTSGKIGQKWGTPVSFSLVADRPWELRIGCGAHLYTGFFARMF